MAKAQTAKTTETPATELKQVEMPTNFKMDDEVKKHGSISAVFRDLTAKGYTRGQISKITDKRYQHVRNVLEQKIKKNQES